MKAEKIKTILIVDDSKIARNMMRRVTSTVVPHAEIFEAENADVAWGQWEKYRPDLGVFDLNMPGKNGLELAEMVLAADPEARLVLCTANVQEVIKERAAEFGVSFINKPINDEKITRLIEGLNG